MGPDTETKVRKVAETLAGVAKGRWDGQRKVRLSDENAALQTSSANQIVGVPAEGACEVVQ
ncbi:hypothetical protein N7491_000020 [Penicillium cf. griseofulvum]|nr:hypothetical protein N7491_000020 [Penicillium cf. griseofulvum]